VSNYCRLCLEGHHRLHTEAELQQKQEKQRRDNEQLEFLVKSMEKCCQVSDHNDEGDEFICEACQCAGKRQL